MRQPLESSETSLFQVWPRTGVKRPATKATGHWVKRQTSATSDFLFIDPVNQFSHMSHASTPSHEGELWVARQTYLWLVEQLQMFRHHTFLNRRRHKTL